MVLLEIFEGDRDEDGALVMAGAAPPAAAGTGGASAEALVLNCLPRVSLLKDIKMTMTGLRRLASVYSDHVDSDQKWIEPPLPGSGA